MFSWEPLFQKTTLLIERKGAIGKVILNRPELHNAFNPTLIRELKETFQQLEDTPEIRVVLLTGAGKSFCAGADLNWMKEMNQYTPEENLADSLEMARLFAQLNQFGKPLIAQVNGLAMGGGIGLVSICDAVIAQEKAKFALSEVRLGLIPAVISPYVLRKIGFSQARRLMLSGENFSAQEAEKIGLVHEVCSIEKLESQAETLAWKYMNNGPKAMAHAKLLLNRLEEVSENLIHFTATAIAERRVTEEGQEGIQALLEKRKPSFFLRDLP